MGRGGSGVRAASPTSIQIEFVYQGIRCRERIKLQPSPANLKRAERHREAILHAIYEGTFDYAVTFPGSKNLKKFASNKDLTTGEWLDLWLGRKEKHIKASTFNGYRKVLTQLKDGFGTIRLSELSRPHIKSWCNHLDATNKTIANLLSPLRAALQEAVEDGLISDNPLINFSYRKNEPPKKSHVDPFTAQEQHAIIQAANHMNPEIGKWVTVAFWTGLRTSEMIALEWADVDLDRGVLHITKAKTLYTKEAETTKTRAGVRQVKVLPPVRDVLSQVERKLTVVFYNPKTDKPWTGDSEIRKVWVKVLRDAKVRYRNPYQTRHTYASMMLTAGENLAWISYQLGHSSVLMTTKVYARYIKDSNPEAGELAVNLFSYVESV